MRPPRVVWERARMGEYLVPFKGRHLTGPFATNFVWRENNFYVMDNHRSALWCWAQHFAPGRTFNYYHVDAHYDAMGFEEPWRPAVPKDLQALTLDEYLNLPMPGKADEQLFRYDNYLSICLETMPRLFEKTYFATHNIGDRPQIPGVYDVALAFAYTSFFFAMRDDDNWLVNVDLDFFYYLLDNDHLAPLFSERFVDGFVEVLANAWKQKRIALFTLCLTPEYCGGWEVAEPLTYRICDAMGVPFRLPGA